jgi:ethanolamine permease
MIAVKYGEPGGRYFTRRELTRSAGVLSLWGLGVAAVISGNFFGWNFGLDAGGFGGMAVATLLLAILYFCLTQSIAEMSAAMPHAGGAYGWCRAGLGPLGGLTAGLADNLKHVLVPAAIAYTVTDYLDPVVDQWLGLSLPNPAWWAILFAVFTAINIAGARVAFWVAILLSLLAISALATFWGGALQQFDFSLWALNIDVNGEELFDGGGPWFPFGIAGIGAAIPFAIWFFLGIEQVPLASEETMDPERRVPLALLVTFATLLIAALLTLVLVAGIEPGAAITGLSNEPLFAGFESIFNFNISYGVLALIAIIGLVASFHAMLFAAGRNIFALSRAGYFPRWMSLTMTGTRTPVFALITASILGFLACAAIEFSGLLFGGLPVGTTLLNMAVFGAIISYSLQMLAYLKLKRLDLARPYLSPLGRGGAALALVLGLVAFVFLWLNQDYRPGLLGAVLWIGAGLLYFVFYARHRLIKSPEEDFALSLQDQRYD